MKCNHIGNFEKDYFEYFTASKISQIIADNTH